MRAIARRAGVTDAALYYYFESKDEIFAALLTEPDYALPSSTPQTPDELLEIALDQFRTWVEHAPLVRLTLREALNGRFAARQFSVRTAEISRARIVEAASALFPGELGLTVGDALAAVRFGALTDLVLRAGPNVEEFAADESFHRWLRGIAARAIPGAARPRAAIVPFPYRISGGEAETDSPEPRADEPTPRPPPAPELFQPELSRRRGRERTRRRIIQAAARVFARRGFDGASMKAIAEEAGLTDAALYYYFRSKREILDALWDVPELRPLGMDPERGEPADLASLMASVCDLIAAQDPVIRLTMIQTLSGDRTGKALREATLARWRRFVYRWAERHLPLDPADLLPTVDAITMAIIGTTVPAQVRYGEEAPSVFRSTQHKQRLARIAAVLAAGPADSVAS